MRQPTPEEEVTAWRRLAWHIDLHRKITMNEPEVISSLNRMSAWVAAHSDANGERPEYDVQKNINEAFWTKIAEVVPKPLPPKRGRGRPRKVQENPDDEEDNEE